MNLVTLCFSLYFWPQVRGTDVRPANSNTLPSLWTVPSNDDRYSTIYTYHPSAPYNSLGWTKIVEATVVRLGEDHTQRDVIDNLQVIPGAFDELLEGMNVNEKVHIVTLVGFDEKCGKAIALNAIGAATTDAPRADESFYNFDFQSFKQGDTAARHDPTIMFGVFATKPFKRFGKWFILQMIRYPPAANGVPDQVLRLRALALQISSGAIFMTKEGSTTPLQDDLKSMVSFSPTNASPLPVVGLASNALEADGSRKMLKDQFDAVKGIANISRVLQPIGDVGEFKVQLVDLSPDFVTKGPAGGGGPAEYFREHYDYSGPDRVIKNLCNNFREAARMGNMIMTSVRDDRSIGVGVLKNLMTDTVTKLNDLTLNVKHMWQQVGYQQCKLVASSYFDSDEADQLKHQIVAADDTGNTQSMKEDLRNGGIDLLSERFAVIWPTVKEECLNALNAEFTAWSEGVEIERGIRLQIDLDNERVARQAAERERDEEREGRLQERTARLAAEARADREEAARQAYETQLQAANAKLFWYEVIEWLKDYWWVIVIGLVGLTILVKIVKICKCCKKTFGKSPQEKLASRLEAAMSTNAVNMPSSQPIRIEIAGGKTRGKM